MSFLVNATPLILVGQWATRSQEQARRNAMAACTVLAARRLERHDVEAFIADYLARRTVASVEPMPTGMAGVG
jgi:hypothetical protein